MNQEQYNQAVEKLETAITTPAGDLRPITRIEFEPIGRQVRWTIWENDRRLYTSTDQAADIDGFLTATKMILRMRAGVDLPEKKEVAS